MQIQIQSDRYLNNKKLSVTSVSASSEELSRNAGDDVIWWVMSLFACLQWQVRCPASSSSSPADDLLRDVLSLGGTLSTDTPPNSTGVNLPDCQTTTKRDKNYLYTARLLVQSTNHHWSNCSTRRRSRECISPPSKVI